MGLWLTSEYTATLVTVVMVPIFLGILVVSIISELIERSKVPKKYFQFLIVSIIIPIIIGLFFLSIYGGKMDWMEKI
jgi:predicted Na+-dependent transporter